MTNLATQRRPDELQVAYSYCLSYLAHLGDRSASKFKAVFPKFESWFHVPPSERHEAAKSALGKDVDKVIAFNFDSLLERALADIKTHEREGIHVLSIDSNEYPELLKQTIDAPLVLFVKGSINPLLQNSNVAVVGTRDATSSGEKVAANIAKRVSEQGWCVVSGLAKGIDAAAHRGTVDVRGHTAAVMATPLNKIYPAENRDLANKILDTGGCWISEIPIWRKFHRGSFVQRDRIQSGLSVAIIPVQTDIEGGTMHTVRYAEQQGRLVLCPRPIEPEQWLKQYAGVRELIESRRAIPFSSNEYTSVLESLMGWRKKLLNNPLKEGRAEATPVRTATQVSEPETDTAEYAGQRSDTPETNTNLTQGKPRRRRSTRLQSGFDFIEELASSGQRKPTKRERQMRIRILEEFRDEIYGPHADREPISGLDDLKLWLEAKIRDLRNQS